MKKMLMPALVLLVMCLLIGAALYGVNALTADTIAAAEKEATRAAAKSVLPDAETIDEIDEENIAGFIGKDKSGEIVGFAFETSSRGYGGDVKCVVGVNRKGEITGVVITADDETPGLGANVKKEAFRDQFIGKTAENCEDVDFVTSASYSSRAAIAAVKEAMENYKSLCDGREA